MSIPSMPPYARASGNPSQVISRGQSYVLADWVKVWAKTFLTGYEQYKVSTLHKTLRELLVLTISDHCTHSDFVKVLLAKNMDGLDAFTVRPLLADVAAATATLAHPSILSTRIGRVVLGLSECVCVCPVCVKRT